MFDSIINGTLSIETFAICIATSLILGFVISFLHMKTARTNKNFVITLFILPTLVSMVILLVNGNLGTSVAALGAFSFVRFRSIPGNSREIMNLFFAMAIGLAVGTGYIGFASLFTIVILIILYLMNKLNYGEDRKSNKILKILIPEDLDYTNCFDEDFKLYLDKYELTQAKTVNMGSIYELTYLINLKDINSEKKLIDRIRVKNGNLKVSITHPLMKEEL